MSSEYNSKLISDLYRETDTEKVIEILEEMGEIADEIFIYPIYDTYLRFQKSNIAHYFVSELQDFGGAESLSIAIKIFTDPNTRDLDRKWLLPFFRKRGYFTEDITKYAGVALHGLASNSGKSVSDFLLEYILEYLVGAQAISRNIAPIVNIVESNEFNRDVRRLALRYLLRAEPAKQFTNLIERIPLLNDKELENIVAKEILTWNGTRVEQLKNIILGGSNSRAKEIIEQAIKKDEKNKEEISQKESEKFANTKIIQEISVLRQGINLVALTSFGIELFPQNEILILQQETATDEITLKNHCTNLRSILIGVSSGISQHGLGNEQIQRILPHTTAENFGKALNSLHLYLYSKNVTVVQDLFGLKKLFRLLGLFGDHPEAKTQLIEELKKRKMENYYISGEWSKIHTYLLSSYKNSLEKLRIAMEKK